MNEEILKWLNLARIDIKNQGEGNDVRVIVTKGMRSIIYQAPWFSKGGAGYVMETYDRYMELELECFGEGELLIRLQGIDRRSPKGKSLPLWVDYTRLAINGTLVFWEMRPQWHDKPYVFGRHVENGEKIKMEFSWDVHGYKGEELANLISLWNGK